LIFKLTKYKTQEQNLLITIKKTETNNKDSVIAYHRAIFLIIDRSLRYSNVIISK